MKTKDSKIYTSISVVDIDLPTYEDLVAEQENCEEINVGDLLDAVRKGSTNVRVAHREVNDAGISIELLVPYESVYPER